MASIQQSRFALLKIEGDEDEREKKSKKPAKPNINQPKTDPKKEAKKKKKQQEEAELKQLAFGMGPKRRGHSAASNRGGQQQVNGKAGKEKGQQWDEWQKLDAEYTKDTFEKDLQQALLLSKLDLEENKQKRPQSGKGSAKPSATMGAGDGKEGKKKKKKDKPNTMSLEEFNKTLGEKKTTADELEPVPSPTATRKMLSESDKKFFESVEDSVDRILRQDRMKEEFERRFATESVITAKYVEEGNKKDKEIEFLRATLKKQEEELKQVKKRNKQLCVILAQGEMKDKAEVLMQVEQLSSVRDELTEQVSDLTAELEKERSKVHTLKTELEKYNNKAAKHK